MPNKEKASSPDRAEELAREIVKAVSPELLGKYIPCDPYKYPFSEAVARVAALLRSRMGVERWIPVSERLPEDSKVVLFWRNDATEFCEMGYYRADNERRKRWESVETDGWNDTIYFPDELITHWRPLPSAPDTEEKA